jgi:predicted RNase H-like HicB family nuclease
VRISNDPAPEFSFITLAGTQAALAVGLGSLSGSFNVPTHDTVSDGELVLFLWPAEEGGYNVTSPLDPALVTQAETVEEAFVMARDALELLKRTRGRVSTPRI